MQIQTTLQQAVALVHQYPRAPDMKILLEVLAQQRNEPSIESLVDSADITDLQHVANWQAIMQYVTNLDGSGVHGHIPLAKGPAQPVDSSDQQR